jgi:hypothetical protein
MSEGKSIRLSDKHIKLLRELSEKAKKGFLFSEDDDALDRLIDELDELLDVEDE